MADTARSAATNLTSVTQDRTPVKSEALSEVQSRDAAMAACGKVMDLLRRAPVHILDDDTDTLEALANDLSNKRAYLLTPWRKRTVVQ